MHDDPIGIPPYDELSEPSLASTLIVWLNVLVAYGAIGIIAFWLDLGIYRWILDHFLIGLIVIFGGLAIALGYLLFVTATRPTTDSSRGTEYRRRMDARRLGRRLKLVWAGAAVVFLIGFLLRTFADAANYNLHNCWTIRSSESAGVTTSILECVPGSEPSQGSSYDRWSDSGGYHLCDHIDTSSSGGTIWRCESGEL